MGVFQSLSEGGQTWIHRIRMIKQVLKTVIFASSSVGLFIFIVMMLDVSILLYQGAWYYIKALILESAVDQMDMNSTFWSKISYEYRSTEYALVSIKRALVLTLPYAKGLLNAVIRNIKISGIFSSLTWICLIIFFIIKGRTSKRKLHISGPKIISPFWLALKLKLTKKTSPIRIGSLPLVKGTETQHMLITGGTGSGKTNCLHHILGQIRLSKQKAIIVDTSGIFLDRYYRHGKDILLNPFDKNSSTWHPWSEGKSPFDYADIAESFIPITQSETENYWRIAAKTVFVSLLKKFEDSQKTSDIVRWLQYESLANLCCLLAGTKAAAHMDLSSEKTASSIRSVASTFLECLENMPDTTNPFSIREWLKVKDDSWLFLQCLPSQRAILRPLISSWISSSVKGLLALPIDLNRRIWFVIDELPTLQRIKDLETLLTEGRKYGGCGVMTIQSPAQIENIYGREVSKIIIGNTATKVIFRESDPEIADKISRAFGECEVMEIQEGISYGAHEARDGVNLSMQNKVKRVVSVTQILDLPINTAFIKLANEKTVSQVKLTISKQRFS